MAFSTKSATTESLKIHIMDKETYNEIDSNGNIKENELYFVDDNQLELDGPIGLTDGGTGVSVSSISELRSALSVAAADHTTYDKSCGIGNALKYGHVKLSDDYMSDSDANEGIAVTPNALKQLYEFIIELINSKADINSTGTISSNLIGYAEIAEWSDGNKDNENRIGYFVTSDNIKYSTNIIKATSRSNIRGVTVEKPGFSTNVSDMKFDSDGNLLPRYNYITTSGIATVIDDGTCIVGETCMCNDAGIAIPSTNELGYQVVSRIDKNHIIIFIEPQGNMMVNLKEDIDNKQDLLTWITTDDIDDMLNGVYDPEDLHGIVDDDDDMMIFLVRK